MWLVGKVCWVKGLVGLVCLNFWMYLILQRSRRLQPGYCTGFGISLLWTVRGLLLFFVSYHSPEVWCRNMIFPMHLIYLLPLVGFRSKLARSFFPITLKWDVERVCHVCSCFLQMGWSHIPKHFLVLPPRRNRRQGREVQPKRMKAARLIRPKLLPSLFCLRDTSLTRRRKWFSPEKARPASGCTWNTRLWNEFRWNVFSCPNALDLFLPHKGALEVPADCVLPSNISAIWFCSCFVIFALWFFTVSLRTSLFKYIQVYILIVAFFSGELFWSFSEKFATNINLNVVKMWISCDPQSEADLSRFTSPSKVGPESTQYNGWNLKWMFHISAAATM